jgi:hypothetical protein
MLELSLVILVIRCAPGLNDTVELATSVKISASRDGGIGRRVGLRIQCPKGVQVQILFPAPAGRAKDQPIEKTRCGLKQQTTTAKAGSFSAACGTTEVVPFPRVPFPEVVPFARGRAFAKKS